MDNFNLNDPKWPSMPGKVAQTVLSKENPKILTEKEIDEHQYRDFSQLKV